MAESSPLPTPHPTPFVFQDTLYIDDEQAGEPIPWVDYEQWRRYGGQIAPGD